MGLAQTYQCDPDHIDYTPSSAVGVGDVVVVGDIFCIADRPIPANVKGALAVEGAFILPKASGSAISAGATVYWDATNSVITTTASSNKRAGVCIEAAASADTTVKVAINYLG
jgi:predicted RecA/RadA family phage recombinase